MSGAISIQAPAKVNLRLMVLAREESGYHSLETIFCGIGLADELEVERTDSGIALDVEGEVDTGPPEQNLVVRAAEAFFDATGLPGGVSVRLTKRIPSAAGLGGGSSDAASMLRALDVLFDRPTSPERLLEIGAKLGSDIPFFLTPTPYALAWSRGERLLSLPPLPQRHVLVAHPGESMSTARAFERLAELREGARPVTPAAIRLEALGDWSTVATLSANDFELAAFEKLPRLPDATRRMFEAGAEIAMLAGSGASIFGVFPSPESLDAADATLTAMGLQTWRTTTLDRWPEPVSRD